MLFEIWETMSYLSNLRIVFCKVLCPKMLRYLDSLKSDHHSVRIYILNHQ